MIIAILIGILAGLWLISDCPKSNLHWLDKLFGRRVSEIEEDTNHEAEEHGVNENGYCADFDECGDNINENE